MEIDFRRLIALLEQEAEICREWIEALERLSGAASAADTALVAPLTSQMQLLQQRMREAERRRSEWVGRLASLLGCPGSEVTVRRIALLAPPVEGRRLQDLSGELALLLGRLRELQGRASLDCRRVAELARSLFEAARGAAAAGVRYGSEGRVDESRVSGAFLSREI